MPMPSQTDVRNIADWSAVNKWEIEFLAFPNAVPGFNSDEIFLLTQSVGIPKRGISTVSIDLHGKTHRRAGRGTVSNAGSLSMTFLGTVDHKVLDLMKKWRDAIYSPDEGVQVSYADYIALVQIRLLDNSFNPYYFFNLKGAYLSDPDVGGTPGPSEQTPFFPKFGLVYDDFDDGPYTAS